MKQSIAQCQNCELRVELEREQNRTMPYSCALIVKFVLPIAMAAVLLPKPFAAATEPTSPVVTDNAPGNTTGTGDVDDAAAWLEQESRRIIRLCRRAMDDGTAAFPPQVGIGYEAFWLRDYAYMLEGYIQGQGRIPALL